MNQSKFKQELNELMELVKKDQLDEGAVCFYVSKCIVENNDPCLIKLVPKNIYEGVKGMINVLNEEGEFLVVSNIGVKNHTELVRKLAKLIAEF